jgi:hypothetical protein
MHVGDMLGVKPSSVAASSSDVGPHNLALNYWASANVPTRNGRNTIYENRKESGIVCSYCSLKKNV